MWVLVMEIDELNFSIAEPQELRQSPNVEKSMGIEVEHEYSPTRIPTPPYHTIQLADFLADEEISRARDGYIVVGVEGNYSEFLRLHLQGCLVGKMVLFFPSKVKFLTLQIPFHIPAW